MTTTNRESPARAGEAETVLLVMRGQRNRELLASWLDAEYEVTTAAPDDDWGSFDVCIVDAASYEEARASLAANRSAASPMFLPVLLLLPEDQRGADWVDREVGETVDQILPVPTRKRYLRTRLESMLRTRRLSVELAEQREHLRVYRRAMDEAAVGVIITDPTRPDNPITYVNDRFEELTGYDEREVVGRNCRFLQGSETGEQPVRRMREAIDAGEPVTVELVNYRKDGTPFWNRVTITPVYGEGSESGEVTYFLGFQEDVTERVERERELDRERERFRALAGTANDAIVVMDADSRVVYANEAVERVFGHAPEAVEGESLTMLMPARFREEHNAGLQRYLETGERSLDWEMVRFRGLHADGHEVPLEVSFADFEGADGRLFAGIVRDVTEREELESDLRAETELLERVFDTSPVGITVLDTEGNIVRANETAEEELGLERSELLSRTYDAPEWDIVDLNGEPVPAEDLPFSRVMRTGEPVADYRHGIRADGETRWLSVNAAALTDEDGNVENVVSTIQDITDRVERRRELERYETIVEAVNEAVWVLDEDKRLTFINQRGEMFGVEPDAAVGQPLSSFAELLGDAFDDYERLVDEFFAGERDHANIDLDIPLPDGQATVNVTLVPLERDGERTGIVGVGRDVTDRVERERERERYETIVEAAADPIYAIDRRGNYTLANEAFLQLFDVSREELYGTHATEILAPETYDEFDELVRDLLGSDERQRTVEVPATFDGEHRLFEINVALLTQDDEFRGSIGVARDITDLRERERRLTVLDRVLRHNLRNKLNIVLARAESIAKETDDAGLREHAEGIEHAGEQLLELSEQARRFQDSIDPGRGDVATVDVADIAAHVVDMARGDHPEADIDADLPGVPGEAWARAPGTLELALSELVENAVEHNDRERPTVRVAVTTEADEVVIRVADDGPGFNEMERRTFLRGAESPLEHMQGVGLWLVRWTVTGAGGDLDIEENDPRGSVVTVRLPRATHERADPDGDDDPAPDRTDRSA